MPELPEVETIKLELNRLIKGKKIKSVEINLAKQVKMAKAKVLRLVQGSKVKRVERRAKVLIVGLDNKYSLVFHLKMTGQLIFQSADQLVSGGHDFPKVTNYLPNKYSHVIFDLEGGAKLFFNDQRQFGYLKTVHGEEMQSIYDKFGTTTITTANF